MTKKVSIDIAIPVLNEETALPHCIERLTAFLTQHEEREWRVIIADNGSDDRTPRIGEELEKRYASVRYARLEQRGRGRAIGRIWRESSADICCYMDVDLSTDLSALITLISAIAEDGYDVAIGSRLVKGAHVSGRSSRREAISRLYNLLVRIMFPNTKVRDAQCGFKAVSHRVASMLVPSIKNRGWFFDTELLILATAWRLKIAEVPVQWQDDPDTRVRIIPTAWEDLKGLFRLRFLGIPKKPRAFL